jgi:glycosyltransferase involved in cell wall biosynthesis
MHIVFVNRRYPPHYGGIAVHNYYLAHALVKLGHRVSVVAARWSDDVPALADDDGVAVHRLLVEQRFSAQCIPVFGRYVRPTRQLIFSMRVSRKLKEMEVADPPDIIEFAEVEAEGFIYLTQKRRRPVIVRCHTPSFVLRRYYTFQEAPYDTSIISAMEKYCIRHADAITAPSRDMAETIVNECVLSPERISVIPNALDVMSFAEPNGRKSFVGEQIDPNQITVLHVGRLERVKGIETLAKAIPVVLKELPEMRFVFIGDDCPYGEKKTWRRRLEDYFREQNVGDRTIFLGALDQPNLLAWYQSANIVVVPSMLYESFSYTCAQAMAAGLPVVATRIGGIPETVDDNRSGLLVAPGDVNELAQVILQFARDAELRKRMGDAGKTKAKQEFDSLRVATKFLEVAARTVTAR